ncbi:MAG: hypothetical protein E7478_01355 [Ruminococcaceae bacterium]|nr:hypothetical protein [Oscillospiraceae bacterium]
MGNAKGSIAVIFCLLMVLGALILSIVQICAIGDKVTLDSFFEGSFEKGQYVKGVVTEVSPEYASVSHTASLIPTGKEHFYIIFNEDYTKCAVVRADKDWDKKFLSGGGVEICGMVKNLDYEVRYMFSDDVAVLAAEGLTAVTVDHYIDCISMRYSVMALAASLIGLLCAGVLFLQRHSLAKTPATVIPVVILFADLGFALHVLAMI